MITEELIEKRASQIHPIDNDLIAYHIAYLQLRLEALEQKEEKSFEEWWESWSKAQTNYFPVEHTARAAWNAARGK